MQENESSNQSSVPDIMSAEVVREYLNNPSCYIELTENSSGNHFAKLKNRDNNQITMLKASEVRKLLGRGALVVTFTHELNRKVKKVRLTLHKSLLIANFSKKEISNRTDIFLAYHDLVTSDSIKMHIKHVSWCAVEAERALIESPASKVSKIITTSVLTLDRETGISYEASLSCYSNCGEIIWNINDSAVTKTAYKKFLETSFMQNI